MERTYIGRYRVVGKLGKGGMGTVIRAVDDGLKREVAIKLPNDSDPDDIRRLQQECDVLMQLQHHNIVQVYGSGNDPDLPFYLVMEFVDGVTVEQLLRQQGGALEPRRALQIALAVAEALAYAHRPPLRVIHRDIKPSNVLIRASDGSVKVTDFGIAAVLAERSGRTVIGTADYMPPEQAKREGVDERSDLYSLGVMLYQMLTGQLPPLFASAPAQPPGRWLGSMPPTMSTRIDALVLGLLTADRAQRQPQSAAQVVEELRALLEGRPSRPLSGPQIDPAIANAPTRRSSSLTPPVTPYPPTQRASAPPITNYQLSGALPASSPQPAALYTPYTPPPGYQLVPVAPAAQKRRLSKKASWSMCLGILPLLFIVLNQLRFSLYQLFPSDLLIIFVSTVLLSSPFFAIAAVVLGHLAIRDIRRGDGMLGGKGRAITGLVLGYLVLALIAGALLWTFLVLR